MNETENERMTVEILGIDIGTASGWDDMETAVFFFYDFEPYENCPLPAGGINVNFTEGTVEVYRGEDADSPSSHNLLDVLNETRRRLLNED